MLKSLVIDNYALIQHSEILFPDGFSVITGETGAGKSILLGALGLLLGQRADLSSLRNPDAKCVVEGVFGVRDLHLQALFTELDLDYDEECVIRREITPAGKSRSFVNDTPVNLQALKSLGECLIDVHSQHQNLLLSNAGFQLSVVDAVAHSQSLLEPYQQAFAQYRKLVAQLQSLKTNAAKAAADRDFIDFQYKQLSEANLLPDELSQLEQEQKMLDNAENIKGALAQAFDCLDEADVNVLSSLHSSVDSLSAVSSAFPKLSPLVERLRSSFIELKDVAQEISALQEGVEVNSERLSLVNERLDLLYSLLHKHKVDSVDQLIQLRDSFEQQLLLIDNSDADIEALQQQVNKMLTSLQQQAAQLSALRQKEAPAIAKSLISLLQTLGMPNAHIDIHFDALPQLSTSGADAVTFLFSANKDRQLQPIASIASGGEVARVMLSLKSVLSRSLNLPTIIFDEIDTGVSGDIASKMGAIMLQMGARMQVISITHLPQIAAKGQAQFRVFKTDGADATTSHIQLLTAEERVTEIAKMLSGDQISEAAVSNARDLLQR